MRLVGKIEKTTKKIEKKPKVKEGSKVKEEIKEPKIKK